MIRANQGPKRFDGYLITEIWTETQSDAEGRYRLFAQADVYDIQVRVPGTGVARLKDTVLGIDEARRLDISLQPGVTFRAKLIDSLTSKPIVGVKLWHWQHKGVEGRSGEDGSVTIADMLPGLFRFSFDAPDDARWWSEQSSSEWGRRQVLPGRAGGPGWQRNFDPLDFDLRPGMDAVTITLEQAVKITGEVRDPDGKTVPRDGGTDPVRDQQLTNRRHALQRDHRRERTFRDAASGERRLRVQPARTRRRVRRVAQMG